VIFSRKYFYDFIFPSLAVIRHVTYFMQHGHEELAYKVLGEYVLANVRGALTVGLAVEKRFAPEPSGPKQTTTAPESITEAEAGSTTEAPGGWTTEAPESSGEAGFTTEAPGGWTTEAPEESSGEEGSATEASVEEKRELRHQNRRKYKM